ncbi:IgGFc-binding protein [Nannocystis pusilla]|uniref:IgGFc-binding protein n=1 Tax=Nannocystis pusilla TaxID=889268 RepID=A0A9X3IV56_9BACT|nr:IgGFc-binding protein [Nannocystis pusilla]MCY1004555.1 IgGFc-binding protein [Nannocystis pusilla]
MLRPGMRHLCATALLTTLAGCGDDGTGNVTATVSISTNPSTTQDTGDTQDPTGSTSAPTTSTSEASGVSDSSDTTTSTTSPVTSSTTDGPGTSTSTTDGPGTSTSTTDGPGTSTSTTDDTTTTSTTGPQPCAEDTLQCDGNVEKICDGMGGFKSETPCAEVCAEPLGCVACEPGTSKCEGDQVMVCNDQGEWVAGDSCDPLLGLACDANFGQCVGACANLGTSYIGCEYYPTVTQQLDVYVGPGNPYAVAVANTTANAATVTVHRGPNQVAQQMVAANSVAVITLPWVTQLTGGTGPTVKVTDGAYRLRSTQPVTVYQFNPLNADVTNDASLLLPVNTWTGNYLAAAWTHWNPYPGFIAITAHQDGTVVNVKAPKNGVPTQAGGGIDAQGNGNNITLDDGDVLQITSANGGDPTGTIVTANKPIQVIGGHDCTQVPIGTVACDHLEESMFPIEALAKKYIVAPPVQVPNNALEKAVIVRVVASEDNTTLTFTPDQPGNKVLAKAGDFVQLAQSTNKYVVEADKKILVTEYMVGQGANFGTSDPAMLVAVPSEQFRSSYLFYAQTAWSANFVDIIAPNNSMVQVDGAAVNNFAAIGASGYSLAHVKLSNAGNGSHTVTSNNKVGISVYGVIDYGSYWYPGGLDLDVIPQ